MKTKGEKMKNKIEVDKETYMELLIDSAKLRLLEEGGVDNWEWYGESLEDLEDEIDEIEREYGN